MSGDEVLKLIIDWITSETGDLIEFIDEWSDIILIPFKGPEAAIPSEPRDYEMDDWDIAKKAVGLAGWALLNPEGQTAALMLLDSLKWAAKMADSAIAVMAPEIATIAAMAGPAIGLAYVTAGAIKYKILQDQLAIELNRFNNIYGPVDQPVKFSASAFDQDMQEFDAIMADVDGLTAAGLAIIERLRKPVFPDGYWDDFHQSMGGVSASMASLQEINRNFDAAIAPFASSGATKDFMDSLTEASRGASAIGAAVEEKLQPIIENSLILQGRNLEGLGEISRVYTTVDGKEYALDLDVLHREMFEDLKNDPASLRDFLDIARDAGFQVHEMAQGGLLSGPTHVLAGEYPGADTNPEVIAPLDKLRGIMQSDFMQGMRNFMESDFMYYVNTHMAQQTQPPRLDAIAAGVAGGPPMISQINNFSQSFTCTDRTVQTTTDRAMQGSVYNAEAELARAIRNQR